MTFSKFSDFQDALLIDVRAICESKGKEYANDPTENNRFANFNRLAIDLGLTNLQVAWIYTAKHLDSIKEAIRTEKYAGRTESLQRRVVDAICYLTLIAGMIDENIDLEHDKARILELDNPANF